MLKSVASIALALGLVFGINSHAKAQVFEPGDHIDVHGYCLGLEAMQEFDSLMTKQSNETKDVFRYLADPATKCVHEIVTRIPINLIATLVKYVKTSVDFEGNTWEWWIVADSQGETAYVWVQVPGQGI